MRSSLCLFACSILLTKYSCTCLELEDATPCQLPRYDTTWQIPRRQDGEPVKVLIYMPEYLEQYVTLQISRMQLLLETQPDSVPWVVLAAQEDQRSHEIYAYYRMQTYPYLVETIDEADIVFFPWLRLSALLMDWVQFGLVNKPPERNPDRELIDLMKQDLVLRRNAYKTMFFADSFHFRLQYRFAYGILKQGIIMRVGAYKFFWNSSVSTDDYDYRREIPIPYGLNSHMLENLDCDRFSNSNTRSISVYFSGSSRRHKTLSHLRDDLVAMPWESINASYKLHFRSVVQTDQKNKRSTAKVFESYLETMLSARFCLILAGDTMTSRRMFEAIACGCVPIILSNAWRARLPFRNHFVWDDISIELDDTLPAEVIFEQIKSIVESNQDQKLRTNMKGVYLQQIWGWGIPWQNSTSSGGYGQATDLLIQEAYDRVWME